LNFVLKNSTYASEPLMFENTVLIAEATLLTPVTHTRAIKATSSAYSTKSWPSSPFFRPWNLT
jgi:hypothetical protein